MSFQLFNPDAPRKATNLSINGDLLAQARAFNINLSRLLEEHLTEALRDARRQEWLTENQQAIADYNQRIAERGSFGDQTRRF